MKQSRELNIHGDYRGIEGAESLMYAANEMLKSYGLCLKLDSDENEEDIDRQILVLSTLKSK